MAHIVVFAGDYDVANKDRLRQTLRRLESSNDLVLDLTEVTFADSSFISELLHLHKAREEKGLDRLTVVTPAKSRIRRLFDVVGLTSILTVVESVGERGSDPDSLVEFAPNGDSIDAAEVEPAPRIPS